MGKNRQWCLVLLDSPSALPCCGIWAQLGLLLNSDVTVLCISDDVPIPVCFQQPPGAGPIQSLYLWGSHLPQCKHSHRFFGTYSLNCLRIQDFNFLVFLPW